MRHTSSNIRTGLGRGRRLLGRWAAALLGAGAALAAGSCDEQPKPDCITTTAPFAFRLLEQSREESETGACEGLGPEGFNALPEVGVVPFFERDDRGQPDYSRGSVAVRTAEVGELAALAEERDALPEDAQLYSLGAFTSGVPDDQEKCHVPELSPTRLVLQPVPATPDDPATEDEDESAPAVPAVDLTLTWQNLEVYVTAEVFGTQVAADLIDTRVGDAGTCTIRYRALGLAPAVPCNALDPETGDPLLNADGSPVLDPAQCDPEADPANGRPVGSGIGAGVAYVCDPVTAFCVLDAEEIPALR